MIILLLALAAPWSDGGGFSLERGTAVQGAIAGGADVLPARIGGVVTVTHALAPRFDLVVALGGGAVTTQLSTWVPSLGVRWGAWQRERDGIVLLARISLPVSVLVATEISETGTGTRAQARIEGVPVELVGAYSHFLGRHFEIGALVPLRIFPTTTGELSYGGGVGARAGWHFLSRFIVAIEATARLERTSYAPSGLSIGGGVFVVPAGQVSFSADFAH